MRNITLLLCSFFFSTLLLGATNRNFQEKSFVFIEDDIEFSLFSNGSFDFYIPITRERSCNTHRSFNTGHHCNGNAVRYNRYGDIIQIKQTPIYYDRYGRVEQIGDIHIRYNHRDQICVIGDLYLNYDTHGNCITQKGYINTIARHYNHPYRKTRYRSFRRKKITPRRHKKFIPKRYTNRQRNGMTKVHSTAMINTSRYRNR